MEFIIKDFVYEHVDSKGLVSINLKTDVFSKVKPNPILGVLYLLDLILFVLYGFFLNFILTLLVVDFRLHPRTGTTSCFKLVT